MAAEILVSVQEYLSATYRPDRDYVDGELVERNAGERDHGWLQLEIGFWLRLRAKELRITPLTEVRLQVEPTRFRIPDVMVLPDDAPYETVIRQAPLLCIEILSKDDSMKSIMGRIHDYLQMGVPTCWIVDPATVWRGLQTPADCIRLRMECYVPAISCCRCKTFGPADRILERTMGAPWRSRLGFR